MSEKGKNSFVVFGTLLIQVITLMLNNIDDITGLFI